MAPAAMNGNSASAGGPQPPADPNEFDVDIFWGSIDNENGPGLGWAAEPAAAALLAPAGVNSAAAGHPQQAGQHGGHANWAADFAAGIRHWDEWMDMTHNNDASFDQARRSCPALR